MEWIEVPDNGLTLQEIRNITKRSQAENAGIRRSVEDILTACLFYTCPSPRDRL